MRALLASGAALAGILDASSALADDGAAGSEEARSERPPGPTTPRPEDPPRRSGWHHGRLHAYDEGLLDYAKFPRAWLADHGVDFYLSALTIGQFIVDGGLEEVNRGSISYDFHVYLDSARLGLWEGGHALVRAEGKNDNNGVNPYTGAAIPVNFDAFVPVPEGTGIEATEWWLAQEAFGGKLEGLFGMWDVGRLFDLAPFSGPYPYRFLNGHMFFNSVLTAFTPYNILGGVVIARPAEWLTITTSVSDPNSSSVDVEWFEAGDFDVRHEWRLRARPFGRLGSFTAGFVYRSKDQATVAQDPDPATTRMRDHDWAVWLNFNQTLFQDPRDPDRTIGLFGRIGITDGKVNVIQHHFSAGLSFEGLIPTRPKDVIGIVGWYNDFSNDLAPGTSGSSSGLEAFYRIQVAPWLQLSPDLQYLVEPGLTPGIENAVVLGIRALLLF